MGLASKTQPLHTAPTTTKATLHCNRSLLLRNGWE